MADAIGEAAPRRPTPIMWHDPAILAHGDLQKWFWEQGKREPALMAMRGARQAVMDAPAGPMGEAPEAIEPAAASELVRDIAREAGADLVGIVRARPEWVFAGYDFDYPWIVLLGVAMEHEKLLTAPEVTAAIEVVDKYTFGWVVARPVADWIRARGWRAEAKGGPQAGPINLIPAALAAGFGELGKHGSIINRELGSSFRISTVFTDLPMIEDARQDIAAADFCTNCQICVNACPVNAIRHERQMVRGEEKWYVDFDLCLPYFAETFGCGICIAQCPWSMPGRGPALSDKFLRRRARKDES